MNLENLEYYEYLENLRESGVTNMYGAVPYIIEEFEISRLEASKIVSEWMDNYKEIKEHLSH